MYYGEKGVPRFELGSSGSKPLMLTNYNIRPVEMGILKSYPGIRFYSTTPFRLYSRPESNRRHKNICTLLIMHKMCDL